MGTERVAAKRRHLIQNCWWPTESNIHEARDAKFKRHKKKQGLETEFFSHLLGNQDQMSQAKENCQAEDEVKYSCGRRLNDGLKTSSSQTIQEYSRLLSHRQQLQSDAMFAIEKSLNSGEDCCILAAANTCNKASLLDSVCRRVSRVKQNQNQVNYASTIRVTMQTHWPKKATSVFKVIGKLGDDSIKLSSVSVILLALMAGLICWPLSSHAGGPANVLQSDPRPTIYSGQVSIGLLLSAHSTPGISSELAAASSETETTMTASNATMATTVMTKITDLSTEPTTTNTRDELADENVDQRAPRARRQIFERSRSHSDSKRHHQQQHQKTQSKQQMSCSQVQPNALYAGMGAIWASHQANLVGDSSLAIGTYVYDSCSDLEVGQRQSVRIVANLNAFQQTTCEAPRGSPISLTIAHGDQQLRAIQLLTSFRVPVISTREHFDLEDFSLLSREQRKFLFSTAPSSRHLAAGSLRFAKRVVARSLSSPKLPNHLHRMSSKNGLIVISRNLPAKFIAHLSEIIPNHVNYELLQSSSPIDQVKSIETLEAILGPPSSGSSSTNGISSSASEQIDTITGESQLKVTKIQPPIKSKSSPKNRSFIKRSMNYDGSAAGSSDDSSGTTSSSDSATPSRMLSPTILMFITTDEAIDLVTRLRNDLAEVSRYYALVVATREDISPALRTIFHRGGSRLCSGKAFYTISPKPDDVSEFARYFRDTVQMEGETSDHPLVCEYAKYQSQNKKRQLASSLMTELDDIPTEAVIKAVWSAAAAFKLVHKRECGSAMSEASQELPNRSNQNRRQSAATQQNAGNNSNNKAQITECMAKMNKNMSNLVQRQLKRLDVTINSTGLQALDGFRIKFDEFNELMTNKFSIKHVNKECEIIEIGQFSGLKDSALSLDEELVAKSLESSLPDPWPISSTPSTSMTGNSAASSSPASEGSSTSSNSSNLDTQSPSLTSGGGEVDNSLSSDDNQSENQPNQSSGEEQSVRESPKRKRSDAKSASPSWLVGRLSSAPGQALVSSQTAIPSPGGLSDMSNEQSSVGDDQRQARSTTKAATTTNGSRLRQTSTTSAPNLDTTTPVMRKLKPYHSTGQPGLTLRDWLPKESGSKAINSDSEQIQTRATTQAPSFFVQPSTSTQLPESGGNTDLDEPPLSKLRAKQTSTTSKQQLETADSTTTSETMTSDYVTLPSIASSGVLMIARRRTLPIAESSAAISGSLPRSESARNPPLQVIEYNNHDNMQFIKDLSSSPVPLDQSWLSSGSRLLDRLRLDPTGQIGHSDRPTNVSLSEQQQQSIRWKLRSHLKWISASWFAMVILGANICGGLLTLYVLIVLLIKNCDGSLNRENQCIRSMHLLAIIFVFFGSTFSWHNFSLVLIFGSLLLQTMQARSMRSIGLGGRPNRLNQFLTLVFMVGVQVAFELQRWRYESTNYMNFVHQNFGSSSSSNSDQQNNGENKRLQMLSSALTMSHFNPLSSLNDQVAPVSLQLSEKYQNLLHEYCTQSVEDFLQSQSYLWFILSLLILFSAINRRNHHHLMNISFATKASALKGGATSSKKANKKHQKHVTKLNLTSELSQGQTNVQKQFLTSGKLLASQIETNQINLAVGINPSSIDNNRSFDEQFAAHQFISPKGNTSTKTVANVFAVTLICSPIYLLSIVLHVHGQTWLIISNDDLISSVTMVLIAFITLIGIFMPILRNVNKRQQHPSDGPDDDSTSVNGFHSSSDALNNLHNQIRSNSSNSTAGNRLNLGSDLNLTSHRFRNLNEGQQIKVGTASSSSSRHSHGGGGTQTAFAMFPEFAPTGLRRPASLGGDSNSGLGLLPVSGSSHGGHRSRSPFANAKESRKNMGAALANLGPSAADSLRNMKVAYQRASVDATLAYPRPSHRQTNTNAFDNYESGLQQHEENNSNSSNNNKYHQHYGKQSLARRSLAGNSTGGGSFEKRLIMLDVDPCCPRHGVAAAWAHRTGMTSEGIEGTKNCHHAGPSCST